MSEELNDQVTQDSQALRSSMENALSRINEEQAANAFRDELRQISSRGDEHAQRVFNNIANQMGNDNTFSNNALVMQDSLCVFPSNLAEVFLGPKREQNVCAWTDGSSLTRNGEQVQMRFPNDVHAHD